MQKSRNMSIQTQDQTQNMACLSPAHGSSADSRAPALTLEQTVARVSRDLVEAGIGSAALDARLLVGHALGKSAEDMVLQGQDVLNTAQTDAVNLLVARRQAREPLAYIIGVKEFWSLDFEVDKHTLIPRPDSETVIVKALEVLACGRNESDHQSSTFHACNEYPLSILDLGTGTGCLLLSLLSELPGAWGVGVDCSAGALRVAKRNAVRHKLADRASFIQADWGATIDKRFNLVITNPPYIMSRDINALAPDVSCFEPWGALDGGEDGLSAYRQLASQVHKLLLPGGFVIAEIGAGQATKVQQILFDQGRLSLLELAPDLAGVPRCVVGQFIGVTD